MFAALSIVIFRVFFTPVKGVIRGKKPLAYISNTLGHGTKHIKDMENVCSSSPLLVPRSGPFRLNVRAALLSRGQ